MSAGTPALVPLSPLGAAKGRLAGALGSGQRRELTLATLATVLEAALEASLAPVVLSREAPPGLPAGASWLPERPSATGLNAALSGALDDLGRPPRLLILHADLPLASGKALARVIAAVPGSPSATLVRSRDGGTNAMLIDPPGGFPLVYGPGSFARHCAAAHRHGFAVAAVDEPALALDLDTPEDLQALLLVPGGAATPAGRLLVRWRLGSRVDPPSGPPLR